MVVWEPGSVIVIPVSVIAKHLNNGTCLAPGSFAVFQSDFHGLLPLVGAPKETVLGVHPRVGDGCPDPTLLGRLRHRDDGPWSRKIGRSDPAGTKEEYSNGRYCSTDLHFRFPLLTMPSARRRHHGYHDARVA
jgi:hypothetical protein